MKIPHWLLLATIVPMLWGVWGALIEIPEKWVNPTFPSTLGYAVWCFTMALVAVFALRNIRWKLESDLRSVAYGCAVGFSGAAGQLLPFWVLTQGPAYIVFPVICLSPVVTIVLCATLFGRRTHALAATPMVTIILSLFIYHRIPTTYNFIGLFLAMVAIFLMAFDEVKHNTPAAGTQVAQCREPMPLDEARSTRRRRQKVFEEFIGEEMGRLSFIAVAILILIGGCTAKAEVPVTVSDQGWTITASPDLGALSVSQEQLGPVLQNVRLNLQDEHGLAPLTGWSAVKSSPSSLTIHTDHPIAAWTFEISPDCLKVSSTLTSAVLTAEAPAPLNRIPARPLDPRGTPVEWVGTNEAMLEYGGAETSNRSFLPSTNPEVMYFALGLVSASNLHALFDRNTDTLIQFTDQTTLRRADQDDNLLDVKMPVPGNAVTRLISDYYTKVLGAPFYAPLDDTYFSTAPMVWSSWTGYYEGVTENDIVRNTDWLAKNLKPFGFQFVQLDDGYDRGKNGEHAWIENWDKSKFPHGPQWLTNYIKSKGMHAGLWLVPNSYAGAVGEHPDWYVRSKDGGFVKDYNTSVLDSSNPEVLAFLKNLFTTLNDWGFEYYKFDGEGSIPQAMPELDRKKLYGGSSDPVAVYRDRLKAIRGAVGPRVFLEGCPAGMPLHGIGYFNSYFNGNDLYNNWQGMYPLFSSINGNAFFNHIFAYVMPGEGLELGNPMTLDQAKAHRAQGVLREISNRENPVTGIGVTDAEARTLVSLISLTGVAYPAGNVMPDLPAERLKLLQQTMPTMPILPLDLFSRGTDSRIATFQQERPDYYIHNYPEILDLKVKTNSEAYDVVGITNWRSESATRKISLVNKLGLDAGSSHVVFDFWNQKLLGVFADEIEIEIQPHDTRVLSIHLALHRPQLIGNSRHITGAYSILDEKWDGSKSVLSGISQSVPGEPYTLWFYVPKGVGVANLGVTAKDGRKISAQSRLQDNSLMVSFEGKPVPVSWAISFVSARAR